MKRLLQIPERYWIPLIAIAFTVLYAVFPTANSSVDAYYYAASVKYNGELFHPHHLLYNATFHMFFSLPFFSEIDILHGMKTVNSFFGGINLYLFALLLKKTGRPINEVISAVFLAGSSFAVMRYASENEVYLLPIIFSMAATIFYNEYLNNKKLSGILISGLFASFAILFHQTGLFWWTGLFLGLIIFRQPLKPKLLFIFTLLPVIFIYGVVAFTLPDYEKSIAGLFKFALRDYFLPGFDKIPGWENFFFTPANLIRSFLQVHGYIFRLFKENILWIIPAIASLFLSLMFLIKGGFVRRKTNLKDKNLFITFLIILALNIVFAFFAEGNAEFMTMIPFLLIFLLLSRIKIRTQSLVLFAAALFIWNVSYGLVPGNKYEFTGNDMIESWIRKESKAWFVLKNDQKVVSRLYYNSGVEYYPNILKSPFSLIQKGRSVDRLHNRLDSLISSGNLVYTDCIDYPGIISRQGVMDKMEENYLVSWYKYQPVDSVKTLFGTYFLHRLEGR